MGFESTFTILPTEDPASPARFYREAQSVPDGVLRAGRGEPTTSP
jgi:hypothetical protein